MCSTGWDCRRRKSLPALSISARRRNQARTACARRSRISSRGSELHLILRSGLLAAPRRMGMYGVMVRDGARAPPHHEELHLPRHHLDLAIDAVDDVEGTLEHLTCLLYTS